MAGTIIGETKREGQRKAKTQIAKEEGRELVPLVVNASSK
jgi:hypothetical protein